MPHHGRWKFSALLLALSSGAAFASPEFPAPRLHENSLELHNTATAVSYNPQHKQADWLFYPLGPKQLQNCVSRGGGFRADPRLKPSDSAQLADYSGSGFDRGHLSPAGDNKWSQLAMSESFYLSNISPQPPKFNQGIWGKLENIVRAWGKNMSLWVATGPVLNGNLRKIGPSGVSVPEYFYKVLATQDSKEAIAILMPVDAKGDLSQYAMPVDRLEEISGLDFLMDLPNEETVEAKLNLSAWNFQAKFQYLPCESPSLVPSLY